MKVSPWGIAFIQSFEGCQLEQYLDIAGKPTIGYGHLLALAKDFPHEITQEQADELFLQDLQERAANPVSISLQQPASQQQFDALTSLCFNIGASAFASSSLLRMFNANFAPESVANQFNRWIYAGGAPSEGLLRRRKAEQEIFLSGVYNNNGAASESPSGLTIPEDK